MVGTINSIALVIGLLVFAGNLAQAYPTPVDFSGQLSRWNIDSTHGPILYEITSDDPSASDFYQTTISDAAALWNSVSSSYFEFQQANTDEVADITITLDGSFSGNGSSSGYAIFDEYDGDDHPTHCQINIDIYQASIAKTTLHELGHCLGLGHSLIPEAIMSYRVGENGFWLDTDDQAAISRLYSMTPSDDELPPGCAVLETASNKSTACLLLMLLLPVFVLAKRKREATKASRPNFQNNF